MSEHNYVAHEREGWSVCTRCGMVRNYDQPITGCRGVTGNIAVRGGMTMTVVEEEPETSVCSVCAPPTTSQGGSGLEALGERPHGRVRECRVRLAAGPFPRSPSE